MSRIFLSAPDITGRERDLVGEVFDANYVAPAGAMLARFEADMAAYTGIGHAVALASGTAALHLALRLAGIGVGDRVWTSSMTFVGGAAPIRYLGAEPVFFDLDAASWTLDPGLLEEELARAAQAGALPAAIVPTDLYGQACDLDRILEVAGRHGVRVISDSAEALGAFQGGRHAGKGAAMAILSFNGNKLITTSGGGMLLSDDEQLVARARHLATQAREPVTHYEHRELGYNYRLSNVCAAIGVGQLEQVEAKIARRRAIFDRYVDALGRDGITFMPEPEDRRSTRWLTCLTVPDAATSARVQAACEAAEIEVRPLWKPMHLQPVFEGTRFIGPGLCEDLFARGLCLPSGSGMSDAEQDRVIEVVAGAL